MPAHTPDTHGPGRDLPLLAAVAQLACLGWAAATSAQEAASAIYVRSDTNHTVVIAPRLRVQTPDVAQTRISAVYSVDVWTSASVDITTSASKRPVTEQRDELDVSLDHDFEDVTLTAAYRYSIEPDYVSHGGSGGFSYDFASNNSTLALGLSGSSDRVGKAGDPQFERAVATYGARVSFTQVLGVGTLAQAMYELSRTSGYQASPYRYVAIGAGFGCTSGVDTLPGNAEVCVPETTPNERLKHALALELRQALGDRASFGLGYRFYTDDWGVLSHTLRGELAWRASETTLLAARYRFYTQGAANYYRSHYLTPQRYVTSDKELSPLSSNRAALELDQAFHFARGRVLRATLSGAAIYFQYRDFIPLDHILAFELNAALVLTL